MKVVVSTLTGRFEPWFAWITVKLLQPVRRFPAALFLDCMIRGPKYTFEYCCHLFENNVFDSSVVLSLLSQLAPLQQQILRQVPYILGPSLCLLDKGPYLILPVRRQRGDVFLFLLRKFLFLLRKFFLFEEMLPSWLSPRRVRGSFLEDLFDGFQVPPCTPLQIILECQGVEPLELCILYLARIMQRVFATLHEVRRFRGRQLTDILFPHLDGIQTCDLQ
ncbi:MAG: hypothetical protein ACRDJT_10575 [Actinomycetota bacterium]